MTVAAVLVADADELDNYPETGYSNYLKDVLTLYANLKKGGQSSF